MMISFSDIVHSVLSSVFLCIQYLSDVALFIVALMPDHRERDFTRIPIVLQSALADTEPTAYGFIVKPFFRFGRTPDKPFDTVDEICKGGAVLLPCLAFEDDKFHCIIVDYVVNTRQTSSFSVDCPSCRMQK